MNQTRHLSSLRKKLKKVAGGQDLQALVRDKSAPLGGGLEAAVETEFAGARLDNLVSGTPEEQANVLRKAENGDFDNMTPREQLQLEAIIEEVGRPVAFIRGGIFDRLPPPWEHFNNDDGKIRHRILAAIPQIGRVEAAASFPSGPSRHMGTGFIVGPNLMMTNRHVAELFVRGVGRRQFSFVPSVSPKLDFSRELGFNETDLSGNVKIGAVLMVHPYWDMALFRIDNLPAGIAGLPLSVQSPEELRDREVAVIGYPGRSRDRSPKAVELEKKYFGTTFGVKRLAPGEIGEIEGIESFRHVVSAMTHDSSTLPGNSGAAILDVSTGEVVGIHFAGITLKNNYSVPMYALARDRRVIDAGLNFIGSAKATDEWEDFWKVADPENEVAGPTHSPVSHPTRIPALDSQVNLAAGSSATLTISISWNGGVPQSAVRVLPTAAAQASPSATPEASFQIPIIHDSLETRSGYSPGFLELDGGEEVPLPELTAAGEQVASRLADGTFELKYHRFSVVMHKKRRLALFTAANVSWLTPERRINGHKPTREELTGIPEGVLEEWVTDWRISETEQLPDIFFTRDQGNFDKGHLVRRDDVAWGDSFDVMQKGNGDTYHTTNCSPQVNTFNQSQRGEDNWGDLENMIQRQTNAEHVIIFSGPVLSKFDRIFKGVDEGGLVKIQIPQQFWKIVVAVTEAGPRAFGFVLKQKLTGVPLEFAVPEDWEPFQTPIQEIEDLLFGLVKLDWLKERDILMN